VQSNVFYQLQKSKIDKVVLTNTNGVYTVKAMPVYDFLNILPKHADGTPFVVKWAGTFGMSVDDSTLVVAFSEGVQQTGFNTCVFREGKPGGYRMLDTHTGLITGQWGDVGAAVLTGPSFKFPFDLHESTCSPNPQWGTIGPSSGVSDTIVWNLGTLNLTEVECTGHAARGYNHIYPGGMGGGQLACFAYTNTTKAGRTTVIPPANLPPGYVGDRHYGFGQFDPSDSSIIWASSLNTAGISAAWENEVYGYDPVKGVAYRVCHTFNSGKSLQFITLNAIACASPVVNGRQYIAFTSDAMGSLGSISGKQVGTPGKDARGDVFVAEVILP
jgi:hypothetical protein